MIKLTIIDSPDSDVIGSRQIDLNFFMIGHDEGNLRIKDPYFENSIWLISTFIDQQNKELRNVISALPNDKIFFINNKKYQSEKSFKIGDEIKIGNTILKILDSKFTPSQDFDKLVMEKLDDLFSSEHPVTELLSQISDLMKRQTKR